jgi:exoribonuclease R
VLSDRVGEVFAAEVVDVRDDDVRVQFREPAVVAKLQGKADLGSRVEVKVAAVDLDARSVELELLP